MIEKDLDIIYNKSYLTIIPKTSSHLIEAISYSIGNTIVIGNSDSECKKIIEFIKNNNFSKIIFIDYHYSFEKIIYNFKNQIKFEFIYSGEVGDLSNEEEYNKLKNIIKLSDLYSNSKFNILDEGLYKSLKQKNKNIKHLILDIKRENNISSNYTNTIGILNDSTKSTHSFYNELSAMTFAKNTTLKLNIINATTKNFLKMFNIKYIKVKDHDLYKNNIVNLYINFTNTNPYLILKSMDLGVPCIVGNTNIFKDNKLLTKYLVVNSDDDVNEIYQKIELVKENRDKIMDEYERFRKTYSEKSKETLKEYLDNKNSFSNRKYEKLLSVIVPVYNTEKYLEKSLKSIIKAKIKNMEIIIINDGSTDGSEKIIKLYEKKYPKLIRYIKQENHGLGNVRNVGLKEAKGKYLAAVDSDDTINPSFFKDAIDFMENDIDLIIYDWNTKETNCKYETPAIDPIHNDKNKYKGLLYTTIMPSTCNKIIKSALFEELNLKYVEDRYEDLSANPFIMFKAETIKYINKPYYEYYIRNNSIMRSKPGTSMIDIINEVDKRINKYSKFINVDIDEFKYYTYSWRIEEYIINPLYDLEDDEFKSCIKYIENNFMDKLQFLFTNHQYLNRINSLPNEIKKYINIRNEAILKGELEKFFNNIRKTKKYQKLTPMIICYGIEKED